MKRIISCIVLIILCVALCVSSSIAVENSAEKLNSHLDLLENEITDGNYGKASEYIMKIEEEWEKSERIFSALSESQLIDELSLQFGSLEKYIQSEETQQIIIVIEQCRKGLDIICEYQRITIDNIL